jgi:hypothetical protein
MILLLPALAACRAGPDTDDTDVAGWTDTGPAGDDDFTSATDDGSFEAEPSIAAGTSGQHVGAAWIAYLAGGTSTRIGASVSHDGGTTWTPSTRFEPAQSWSTDPVVAVGDDDRVYVAWLSFERGLSSPTDMHLWVSRTEPGGDVFEAHEVPLAGDDVDKPWIVVDSQGRVLVSFATDEALFVARSTDQGVTFTTSPLDSDAYIAGLCTDRAAGDVFAVFTTAAGQVEWASSADGGAAWTAPAAVPGATSPLGPFFASCAAGDGRLSVAWGVGTSTAIGTLRTSTRADGAWSDPIDASDPADGALVNLGQIAAGPGRIELAWLQADAMGAPASLVRGWTDGGPVEREVIADVGAYNVDRSVLPWYGDYQGLAAGAHTTWLAFGVAGDDALPHIELERRRSP